MLPVRAGDRPGEPVLHVSPQRVVHGRLGQLRTPTTSIGMPLRSCGLVLQVATASRVLRRSSREIVDGERPSHRAISRTLQGTVALSDQST